MSGLILSPRRLFLYLLSTILIALLTGCGPSHLEIDNEQGRIDEAAPVLDGTTTVGQTFVSHRSRLAAVEVLLVVYADSGTPSGEVTFHLRSDPASSQDLVTRTFRTDQLTHNQTLTVTFEPQPGSEGQSYYFYFEGTAGSQVTVWYNSVDAYGEGEAVIDGQPTAGDLQFNTFYAYSLDLIARDVLRGARRAGWLALPLLALLFLPGYLALLLTVPLEDWPDPMLQTALAIGLSVAILPLVLLFATLLDLALTPALLMGLLGLMGVATLWRLAAVGWRPLATWRERSVWPTLGLFTVLLCLTLALRLMQARNLVVPAWVDGVHHTMIVQLITEQGRVPADYRPYLDMGTFIYHFGFHTVAAALVWLTGLEASQAVLIAGQVLNALVGVGVYALTNVLMGRRSTRIPGLVAMGVVGTISLMPAYYVTWGRYTQLTGLAVLPAAAILTLWWIERGQRRILVLASITVAGLGLVHYRVLIFYAAFVSALLAYRVISIFLPVDQPSDEGGVSEPEPEPRITDALVRVVILAGLSLLLLSPWIVRLLVALVPTGRGAGWFRGQASFNVVPRGLIDVGYDRVLLRLALLSFLLGLLWWHRVSILIGLWIAGVILAANPSLLGGGATWLLSNTVLVITLFLPMAVLTGVLVGRLADVILRWLAGRWRIAVAFLMACLFLVVMLVGAWNSLDIVNPVTVVATQDDMTAMTWIRENTAPSAGFITNVRVWQYNTYMGADGGYWIPLLTGRRTLVPPAIYSFGSRTYYFEVQDVLETLASITQARDPRLKNLMDQHGIKYVYLGAKGGQLDLKSFLNDPNYAVAYSNGAVWIFRAEDNATDA